jgi:uncharacterized radical SAM protein YgiQ
VKTSSKSPQVSSVQAKPVYPVLNRAIFSYRKNWASRYGSAEFLPMTMSEVEALGWGECDVVLVSGDAYVDHPSFGTAMIGRLLEAQGFRVAILAQPRWHDAEDFRRFGRPRLYFGITAGNMDSMVNHYTADRKPRSQDAYSPDGRAQLRPDRATLVYAQRCREAYPEVPIVLGGVEASLRRFAHYDYWSDKVRRSLLLDAKADLLLYGNAERALVELTHGLAKGAPIHSFFSLRGVASLRPVSVSNEAKQAVDPEPVTLPSFEEVQRDKRAFAVATRLQYLESNWRNARPLVQRHGDRELLVTPPPQPLSSQEFDAVYELPYAMRPHPSYAPERIPAYETTRFSVVISRGCFGGCSFCALALHEGRSIQSRSSASVLSEIDRMVARAPGFSGVVSDLGGPTANSFGMYCGSDKAGTACRRLSCLFPNICKHLRTDHGALIALYRAARSRPGVRKVLIGSGIRHDVALRSPEYIDELVQHHVGGYLKLAPEHTESAVLDAMMKPEIGLFERFCERFDASSQRAGKRQYVIPYLIAAHPGCRDEDMLQTALWLKRRGLFVDQVQTFLPAPGALATAMYYTGLDPRSSELPPIEVPRGARQRRLQKAFLRYHDANNWPLLREALLRWGRAELIGAAKRQLVPRWQPKGTGSPKAR